MKVRLIMVFKTELSVLNRSYNTLLFAFKLQMFCLTRETQSLVMTCY